MACTAQDSPVETRLEIGIRGSGPGTNGSTWIQDRCNPDAIDLFGTGSSGNRINSTFMHIQKEGRPGRIDMMASSRPRLRQLDRYAFSNNFGIVDWWTSGLG